MMHGCGKSDFAIVAEKPANKAEQSAAESVEPRAETKGNANQQSTHRTQSRVSVSQALERMRQAFAVWTRGRSRMRESCMYGSVRGARGNSRPYRDRREFITLLGGVAAWPLTARGQQMAMPVIGYLSSLGQAISVRLDAAFRRGLSDMGYFEGQDVSVEYRWITDRYEALPGMAADLVQRQATVIFALGPPAVLAAKAASPTTPIVFVTGADPLKFGFVASFNKPGGNITGIWMVLTALTEKRLQLMHDLLPKAQLIGLLVNPASPVAEPQIREAQAAAHVLGVRLTVLSAVT